jgi:hypothetical protein
MHARCSRRRWRRTGGRQRAGDVPRRIHFVSFSVISRISHTLLAPEETRSSVLLCHGHHWKLDVVLTKTARQVVTLKLGGLSFYRRCVARVSASERYQIEIRYHCGVWEQGIILGVRESTQCRTGIFRVRCDHYRAPRLPAQTKTPEPEVFLCLQIYSVRIISSYRYGTGRLSHPTLNGTRASLAPTRNSTVTTSWMTANSIFCDGRATIYHC